MRLSRVSSPRRGPDPVLSGVLHLIHGGISSLEQRLRGRRHVGQRRRADRHGEAAVEAYHEKCGPELSTDSPAAMTDDSVQLYVLYPTADTWASGDRAVTCIATLDPPRTGSIKS